MLDAGKEDAARQAYLSLIGAMDMAMMVTDRAVQVLGGHGYIREHPVELWMRNGRRHSHAHRFGCGLKYSDHYRRQMMIEFEPPKPIVQQSVALTTVAENMMRPVSRYFDDHEHEIPWDYITSCIWPCAPPALARSLPVRGK